MRIEIETETERRHWAAVQKIYKRLAYTHIRGLREVACWGYLDALHVDRERVCKSLERRKLIIWDQPGTENALHVMLEHGPRFYLTELGKDVLAFDDRWNDSRTECAERAFTSRG